MELKPAHSKTDTRSFGWTTYNSNLKSNIQDDILHTFYRQKNNLLVSVGFLHSNSCYHI